MNEEINRGKIRWQCRRGMLELDRIMRGFFDARFEQLPLEQQQAFEKLLQESDPDIYSWVLGFAEPNTGDYREVLASIKDYLQH